MATIFSKNQMGVQFNVRLIDCITGAVFDIDDVMDQAIIFYKPDGIRLFKAGILVPDPENPTQNTIIQYTNSSPEESILDLVGKWEFSGEAVMMNGDMFESQERQVFWVK